MDEELHFSDGSKDVTVEDLGKILLNSLYRMNSPSLNHQQKATRLERRVFIGAMISEGLGYS